MSRGIAFRLTFVFAALVATLGRLPAAAAAEAAFVGLEIKGLNVEVAAALGLDREDGAMVSNVDLDGPANRAIAATSSFRSRARISRGSRT